MSDFVPVAGAPKAGVEAGAPNGLGAVVWLAGVPPNCQKETVKKRGEEEERRRRRRTVAGGGMQVQANKRREANSESKLRGIKK